MAEFYEIIPVYRYFDIRWGDPRIGDVIHQVLKTVPGVVKCNIVESWTTRVWYEDGITFTDMQARVRIALAPAIREYVDSMGAEQDSSEEA